jgi:hypothetical protein
MKRKISKIMGFLISLTILTQSIFATGDPNIDGGGGGMGQGTNDNGWAVMSERGRLIFNAEGFRVYLVNSITGVPVSASVDITNSNVARINVYNGQGKTKYDYRFVNSNINISPTYNYVRVNTSPKSLPRIIPWNEGNSDARIEAIKYWFLDETYADWVLAQLGTNIDEVRAGGYLVAIEPIAYFRYQGYNYAMTATEVALTNKLSNSSLRNSLGSLTHQNLPLSLFLEHDEFVNSSFRQNAWTGSRTARVSDDNIIDYLGIGYVRYFPDESNNNESGSISLYYPSDTWVVTSFRLCNVRPSVGNWTDELAITSRNPANASIKIGSTNYKITNIYIPPGGEQVIWVKWKTPSAPQTITATARGSAGVLYNRNNAGISNRYVSEMTANITIYSNDMEDEPPDPTLDDTPKSMEYSALDSSRARSGILKSGGLPKTNSWHVWDCNWQLISTYTFDSEDVGSVENYYNQYTGIYYEYQFLNSGRIRERQYKYQFNRISYRAEIQSAYIKLTPDTHCPTAYTKNYKTYMKSGYGVNLESEAFIKITTTYERTGSTSTETHYSPSATSFAVAPQYVNALFNEFGYGGYNRQLEFVNNKFVFKKNRFSTYNSRVHYTPWWMPDGTEYDVLTLTDFAYTPAGKLAMFGISNPVVIDGVLIDDWRIVKTK